MSHNPYTSSAPLLSTADNSAHLLSPHAIARKVSSLSNSSSTYSNQTQHSFTSNQSSASQGSVVVSKSADVSKATIQSSVLDYIKNSDSDFNPNELFQQRQQRNFITNFDKTPSQKLPSRAVPGPEPRETSPLSFDQNHNDQHNSDLDLGRQPLAIGSGDESEIPTRKNSSIFFNDSFEEEPEDENFDDDDYDYDYDDAEDDDDMPSPPRSPPREIDPGKLYGLYDFSGPDPSHCSIARNEPVYLINDQDNYWWLIKKLTKQERVQLTTERNLNKSEQELNEAGDEYLLSDEEDGKIGFVPAECLETYGERLARLNCFKNEELEKSSRDLLVSSNPSSSDNVLGSPVIFQKTPDTTISRSGSILRDGTKQLINKSVTFEDLGVLELNENSDSGGEDEEFPSHYNIPEIEEIHREIHADDDKKSEILSETFPSESPLVISKRKSTSGSPSPPKDMSLSEITPDTPQSDYQTPIPAPLNIFAKDNVSPEYRTPGECKSSEENEDATPVENYKTPQEHDYDYGNFTDEYLDDKDTWTQTPTSERLRRSEILTRLNQVTSDIQNELDGYDEDLDYRDTHQVFGTAEDKYLSDDYDSRNSYLLSFQDQRDSVAENDEDEDLGEYKGFDDKEKYLDDKEKVLDDKALGEEVGSGYGDILADLDHGSDLDNLPQDQSSPLRPQTSLPKPTTPDSKILAARRKSTPVHDMFVPILGKFDELAEKLAEIDDML
ncbi:protein phosphatase regulator [Yamadazyma tenuis]|uniref:SH3 domain-containing protein n=1 Tax=Candida tenuis (strain ATCC 10573 / BCRC 21748 / CBS 615 / JCM 9827 / NBRC 10315 / NRRL Y-1498 / VKM Y-70) TaxID=590646 RepID=G3BB34_CANTC|nr:uncharacterized protein CANTEDRAFT_136068 [Yamadazyma tenuis ATCC 10573]EGV62130.1 hypothetical protein CANTEDRAFT_136068 [Yamadazyma tenuis ATCC 10573]WEJ93387.1 protein phosphatase regulator [Yamadazyma tenuis]